MLIKEAAARASLTERAVRLYEERGLISPRITVKNGRDFREYDEDDVETLRTISTLRRAFFSLDEIEKMMRDPSCIEDIFEAHGQRLRKEEFQLSYILSRTERVDIRSIKDAKELSDALGEQLSGTADKAPQDSTPADDAADDGESEELGRTYNKYFAEDTEWDRRYETGLRVSGFFGRIGRFFTKKSVIASVIVLAVALAALFFPRTENAEFTYSGMLTKETGEAEKITATVRGKYIRSVGGGVRFSGVIETSAFDNASSPGVPARFSFTCSLRPDNKDVDGAKPEKYIFSPNSRYRMYGIFDGEKMESLSLLIYTDGQLMSASLSQGEEGSGAHFFPDVFFPEKTD